MPHIRVQMYPGRDEATKEKLTQSLCECLQNVLASDEKAISVSIEEIAPENWNEKVIDAELKEKPHTVTKWPDYYKKK